MAIFRLQIPRIKRGEPATVRVQELTLDRMRELACDLADEGLHADANWYRGRLAPSTVWVGYPTSQDAWYYAQFINSEMRQTVCHAEGDLTRVTCETQDQCEAELADLARFHGTRRHPCATSHDKDGKTVYFDTLTLLKGRVVEIRFDRDAPARNSDGSWKPPLVGHLRLDGPIVLGLQVNGHGAVVPKTAFTLDLLNPRAFRPYSATVARTEGGLHITLTAEADTYTAVHVDAKFKEGVS